MKTTMKKFTIKFKYNKKEYKFSTMLECPIIGKGYEWMMNFIHNCYEKVGVTDEKQATCRECCFDEELWVSYTAGVRSI